MIPHGLAVAVVGSRLPALSISWAEPAGPVDSGFLVFFSECDREIPSTEWPATEVVCLHCLIEAGDEQLGRGLDLAKNIGWSHVDWDVDAGRWFIPDDAL